MSLIRLLPVQVEGYNDYPFLKVCRIPTSLSGLVKDAFGMDATKVLAVDQAIHKVLY